jgi:hypothetical protein
MAIILCIRTIGVNRGIVLLNVYYKVCYKHKKQLIRVND